MDRFEFEHSLGLLREGKLQIRVSDSGMSEYASTALYELRHYVAALEAGYRSIQSLLDGYRANVRAREQTPAAPRWSGTACLGYAVLATQATGDTPDKVVSLLEALEEAMEACSLEEAEQAYNAIPREGRQGEKTGDPSSVTASPCHLPPRGKAKGGPV